MAGIPVEPRTGDSRVTDDRQTYTVAELISALQGLAESNRVEVYSGCHDCGGKYLEVDIYDGFVQIVGHQWLTDDEDDE